MHRALFECRHRSWVILVSPMQVNPTLSCRDASIPPSDILEGPVQVGSTSGDPESGRAPSCLIAHASRFALGCGIGMTLKTYVTCLGSSDQRFSEDGWLLSRSSAQLQR